jgi:hypothetical protein
MTTAYFDALGALTLVAPKPTSGGFIKKKALLFFEGIHKSNDGRTHTISPQDVEEYARNTNLAMDRGVEFPLILDHSKTIVHKDGKPAKFGEVISDVACRVISERDLPNPKMRHLLGKVGAFAEVEVRDRIEDVQKGLIKLLSPGLNLEEKRFMEASGVLFPAIHGPALFAAALDYDTQRELTKEFGETRQKLNACFEDACRVWANIESADDEQTFGNDKNAMRRSTLEKMSKEMGEILGIEGQQDSPEGEQPTYNPDPYARQLVNPRASMSEFETESEEVSPAPVVPLKRRRRTASFSSNGARRSR